MQFSSSLCQVTPVPHASLKRQQQQTNPETTKTNNWGGTATDHTKQGATYHAADYHQAISWINGTYVTWSLKGKL